MKIFVKDGDQADGNECKLKQTDTQQGDCSFGW